jgi:hypothetical protein
MSEKEGETTRFFKLLMVRWTSVTVRESGGNLLEGTEEGREVGV